MLKKLLFATLGALLLTNVATAQDPEFSQFYAAPLYLNPAFAGNGGPKVHLNYRNQWPGIDNAYEHFAASYDQYLPGLNGGLGLLVTSDNQGAGIYKSTNIGGIYAYQIKAGDNFAIKPSLQATFSQRALNSNGLKFKLDEATGEALADQQEPTANLQLNKSFIDFAAGILLYSDNFFAGFAADHLAEPNQSLSDKESVLPRKYTGHIGAVIPIDGGGRRGSGTSKSVSPNLMYQRQGPFNQLNAGIYYNAGPLVLGGWYRFAFTNGDAIIALIGFKPGIVRIGYSYDYSTSALRAASAGAHEVSLSLEFDKVYRRSSARFKKISCPAF